MKCGIIDCIKSANTNSLYCIHHQKRIVKTPYGKYTLTDLETLDMDILSKMVAKVTNITEKELIKRINQEAVEQCYKNQDHSLGSDNDSIV